MIQKLVACAIALGCASAHADPAPILIWPGAAPDPQKLDGPEVTRVVTDEPVAGKPWTLVGRVATPTITVYPAKGKSTGAPSR